MKRLQRVPVRSALGILLTLPVAFAVARTTTPTPLPAPGNLPSARHVLNLSDVPRLESRMPVLVPDARFRDPMPVFLPDSSIDFTLRIVRPPLQSAPTPTPP